VYGGGGAKPKALLHDQRGRLAKYIPEEPKAIRSKKKGARKEGKTARKNK